MKKSLAYLFTSVVALSLPGWSASINGQVNGGMGGVATTNFVPNANVVLVSGSGNSATLIDQTVTDANGNFSFSNVPTGFIQVVVSADGFTPNPSTTVLAVNSPDTAISLATIVLLQAGSQVLTGTSNIGGQITTGTNTLAGIQVTLRRRGTSTSAYVLVDSTLTDSLGSYEFQNIISAGPNSDINAYSLIVNAPGYNSFTSGNLTVADGFTLISNIALTPTALFQTRSNLQTTHFSRAGGQLMMELGLSNSARTVEVYGLNGSVRVHIPVPAGVSNVVVPSAFAPEKGFFFRVK